MRNPLQPVLNHLQPQHQQHHRQIAPDHPDRIPLHVELHFVHPLSEFPKPLEGVSAAGHDFGDALDGINDCFRFGGGEGGAVGGHGDGDAGGVDGEGVGGWWPVGEEVGWLRDVGSCDVDVRR